MTSLNKKNLIPELWSKKMLESIYSCKYPFSEMGAEMATCGTVKIRRYPELKNQPVKIHMAGWTSDTYTLQRHGWQVSVEEMMDPSHFTMRVRVALKHPTLKLYCVSDSSHYDRGDQKWMESYDRPAIELQVKHIACDIRVLNLPDNFSNFRPIDATPLYDGKSIEDFKIFKPLPPDKNIIVPQKTVGELLAKIHEIQEPYQELLREEKRTAMKKFNKEVNEYDLATNIVAQVATLA